MQVAIVGFGLLGGSIARAVRARGDGSWRIAAWSPTGRGPRQALADGTVDSAPDDIPSTLDGAALIVLAAPPVACLALVDALGGPLRDALAADAVVTDVSSTKAALVARAAECDLRFVGGHPMAGRERSGYEAADPDLFVGRPWVVVPGPDAEASRRVEALARACGALPVPMDAAEHDAAVAGISHLPLIVSAALVESVAGSADWPVSRRLAAGGWASMTRLARGDVEMGADIVATNGPALLDRLSRFRSELDAWIAELEAGEIDRGRVRARLADARARLEDPG